MGRRRHTPEQIITVLREAEVALANGKTVGEVGHQHSKDAAFRAENRSRCGDEPPGSGPLQGSGWMWPTSLAYRRHVSHGQSAESSTRRPIRAH